MKLLIVEDERGDLIDLLNKLETIDHLQAITAESASAAINIINSETSFDLAVCDLKIPRQEMSLEKDRSHGLEVVYEIRRLFPGTPVIVHSGHADRYVPTALYEEAPREDFAGRGVDMPLVRSIHKKDIALAVEYIEQLSQDCRALDGVRVNAQPPQLDLSREEKRVLQIYARRHEGSLIQVRELSGGLSESRVFELVVQDRSGGRRAEVVAKTAQLSIVEDEMWRFRRYVGPRLGIGTCATVLEAVKAGAGATGALFYQVARESESLFDVLRADHEKAVEAIEALEEGLRQWHDQGIPMEVVTVGTVRRQFAGSLTEDVSHWADSGRGELETFEEQELQVRPCFQHRDLHGDNILIGDGGPVLIDYGRCGDGVASLDAVTLELSTVFHPSAVELTGSWPSRR